MTGIQLKLEVRKLNITQEDAASKLGVTRQTLQNWFKSGELDANILQTVKTNLGIGECNLETQVDINSLIEANKNLTETIKNLSETIKNLTSK